MESPRPLSFHSVSAGEEDETAKHHGDRPRPKPDRDDTKRTARDEFWEALMSNYNYLMDDGLIASCKEANGELTEEGPWSFTEFIGQFNHLHDWLHRLQTLVLLEEDPNENRVVSEELQKVSYLCQLFRDQAHLLGNRYPDMKDELQRRINLLNNKWEALQQATPIKPPPTDNALFQEVAYQMRCLRRWLREVESQIQPFAACATWSLEALEKLHAQQKALQCEIESRGQFVSTLLRTCDSLPDGELWKDGRRRVARVASNLQRRWHALWLRSLEWQCYVEDLLHRQRTEGSSPPTGLPTDDEPARKFPRLSGGMMAPDPVTGPATNDKGVMVGVTGIAQLKAACGGCFERFEIVQDVGYSSESSAQLSTDGQEVPARSLPPPPPPDKGPCYYDDHLDSDNIDREIETIASSPELIHRLVAQADLLVQREEEERVAAWLEGCGRAADSSCDASGECSEGGGRGSEEESAAGSAETVAQRPAPALPAVALRPKKRRTRSRPWSLAEEDRKPLAHSAFSTSEGALHKLLHSSLSKPLRYKGDSAGSSSGSSLRGPLRPRRRRSSAGVLLGARRKPSPPPQDTPTPTPQPPPTDTDHPEDQSSVSDQVWDGYQDPPYFSEPYSEQAVDEELVRRILEFGDDYRAFIGSDASSVSGYPRKHRPGQQVSRVRRRGGRRPQSDSDSEVEELYQVFRQQTLALHRARIALESGAGQADLLATCHTHLKCLKDLHAHLQSIGAGPDQLDKLKDLVEQWEELRGAGRQGAVAELVGPLAARLDEVERLVQPADDSFSSPGQVEERVKALQGACRALEELRGPLLRANLRARQAGDGRQQAGALYRRWEDLQEQANVRLSDLELLHSRWMQFNDLLDRMLRSGETADVEAQLRQLKELATSVGATEVPAGQLVALTRSLMASKEQPRRPSRFWRVLRAALPLQLALVLLCCLAGLLEPGCCDLLNSFSLGPQLRYLRGPPPV